MTEDKLIKIGVGDTAVAVEMAYISEELFSKLMAKGHVRWDGIWLSGGQTWQILFIGLAMHKVGQL